MFVYNSETSTSEFLKAATVRPHGHAKVFKDCARFGFLNAKMHEFHLFWVSFQFLCWFSGHLACAKLLNRNIGPAKKFTFRRSALHVYRCPEDPNVHWTVGSSGHLYTCRGLAGVHKHLVWVINVQQTPFIAKSGFQILNFFVRRRRFESYY